MAEQQQLSEAPKGSDRRRTLELEMHELCVQLVIRIGEYDLRYAEDSWPAAQARGLSGQLQKFALELGRVHLKRGHY